MLLFPGLKHLIKPETIDFDKEEEKILERLEACLGKLPDDDSYKFKRSYFDLWNRSKDKRIAGPVGILEEYCRLYEYENNSELQNSLDSPRNFSDKFVNISLNIRLDRLGKYYKNGENTLRRVNIGVRGKTLNNKDVCKEIKDNFYEVPKEWLLV